MTETPGRPRPSSAIELASVTTADDVGLVAALFTEYARWIGIDLSFQRFDEELAGLPGDYAPPGGRLVLARIGGDPAGCVAVRRVDERAAEMKRLFVRERYRGTGCGRRLAVAAIDWARDAGYARLVLDTLPSMQAAQRMYERLGFVEIPAYRFNPVPGTRYLGLAFCEEPLPAGDAPPPAG